MLKLTTNLISSLTLNIDLNQNIDLIPKSISIKKYIDYEVETVLDESLLEEIDAEHVSFKPNQDYTFRTFFNKDPLNPSNPFRSTYTDAGFEPISLTANSIFKEESFYLFDLYDNFNDVNQKLISRNFVKMSRIVTTVDTTDIKFEVKTINKEYTNIYIPSYFIDTTADTFYLKISFFNATNGKLRFFECSSGTDSLKNYFELKINKNNKTYQISNGIILSINPNTYRLFEVIEQNKEKNQKFGNTLSGILPIRNNKTTVTTRGRLI
jgi:hypothetical protein